MFPLGFFLAAVVGHIGETLPLKKIKKKKFLSILFVCIAYSEIMANIYVDTGIWLPGFSKTLSIIKCY